MLGDLVNKVEKVITVSLKDVSVASIFLRQGVQNCRTDYCSSRHDIKTLLGGLSPSGPFRISHFAASPTPEGPRRPRIEAIEPLLDEYMKMA